MAAKKTNTKFLVGTGLAILAGFVIYREYEKRHAAKAFENSLTKDPATVLESLTTNSPTHGAGVKQVTVRDSTLPVDCESILPPSIFPEATINQARAAGLCR